MSSIRIILASKSVRMRRLLSDLLVGQPDLELVGEFDDPLHVLLAVRENRAHVVVLESADAAGSGLESHLLAEYPHLLILGVLERGAFVERLCPLRSPLPSDRPADLADELRRLARAPCF